MSIISEIQDRQGKLSVMISQVEREIESLGEVTEKLLQENGNQFIADGYLFAIKPKEVGGRKTVIHWIVQDTTIKTISVASAATTERKQDE
jgi:hypothetical protein